MNPQDLVIFLPAIIGSMIFGLKRALGSKITKKYRNYIPIASMALGGLISLIFIFSYDLTKQQAVTFIVQGIVIGAAAVGYREAATRIKTEVTKDDTIE